MFALLLLAVTGVVLNDRATVFYSGERHRGEPNPFQTVEWRRMPTPHELGTIVPRGKTDIGYGHLRCSHLARSGKISGCAINKGSSGDGIAADPDFDRAALRAVRFFRAAPRISHDPRPVESVSLDLRFYVPGPAHGLGWGDCTPFCVIEPSLPPPPAPPQ